VKRIKAIVKLFNNVRIKNKLIVSYILVVFIPVIIVGVFLTVAFRQYTLDQATEQVESNVERIKKQTYDIIRKPIEISDKLLIDMDLANVVNTEYKSTLEVVQAY